MRACLLAVAANAAMAAAGAATIGTHDGESASTQKGFLTTLAVIEGDDDAVISYTGGFGPGCSGGKDGGSWCRSCDFGPEFVHREGPTSFVFTDEDGKIRVALVKGVWQLELTEGTFSGCGVGWRGDRFQAKGVPSKACVVVSTDAQLDVPRRPGVASAKIPLAQGTKVAAITDQEDHQVMVRAGRLVGVLHSKDVDCGR